MDATTVRDEIATRLKNQYQNNSNFGNMSTHRNVVEKNEVKIYQRGRGTPIIQVKVIKLMFSCYFVRVKEIKGSNNNWFVVRYLKTGERRLITY